MGGGGGGNGLLDMGLMVAAGIAAPELAAEIAPEMMAAGGASGAAVGAATGAGLSGLTAAAIGKDPLQAALMGGVGGAITGYMPDVAPIAPGTPTAPTLPGATVDDYGNALPNLPSTGAPPTPALSGTTPGYVAPPAPTSNMFGQVAGPSNTQLYTSAGIDALGAMSKRPVGAYTPPNAIDTGGGLSKFKYDPNNYTPDVVVPQRPAYQANYSGMAGAAQGGLMSLAAGGTATSNPGQFSTPLSNPAGYQLTDSGMYKEVPSSTNTSGISQVDPLAPLAFGTDAQRLMYMITDGGRFAKGGITNNNVSDLGSYSDGGRLLKGPGDGMSDDIPATIGGKQEARLADGEFVVPADVVSGLGNGSTDAGAKHLYKMMDKVRHARTGKKSQAKQIKGEKFVPA